jgi:ribosomal protein RSM22 (predicted rRNA methylase)
MFYDPLHRTRRYQCLPITYSYVEWFAETFASEIYRILFHYDEIWKDMANMNILSIGCGPATELIAVEKIMRDKSIIISCQYIGFDKLLLEFSMGNTN